MGIVKERTFETHFALTTRSRPKAKVAKKDKPDQPSDKPKNTASRKKLGRTADSRPKKDTAKTAKPDPERQVKPTKTPDEIAEAREKAQQVRREYDRIKNKSPERREYNRRYAQEQRRKAKELGRCWNCSKPAILGQTRCPTCTEAHRQSRRRSKTAARGEFRERYHRETGVPKAAAVIEMRGPDRA